MTDAAVPGAPLPVVVAGAGPTGLVAALLLARHGQPVVLLERHPAPYPLPRAVHLDDEAVRVLQRAGVAEEFLAHSRPGRGLRLLDARHRVMAEFPRSPEPGPYGYPQANMFDQPDLEGLLLRRVARHPLVRLRSGVELVDAVAADDAAGVRVRLRDAGDGRTGEMTAAALLGCDGADSTVCRLIGARLEDLRFTERWLVIDVHCGDPLRAWPGVHQVCDPRRAATFMQVGPDRYRWEFRLADGEEAVELTAPTRLRELLAPWTAAVPAGRLRVLRQAEYTFRARVADRWRAGRIFLLGDAAHQTPPFIGQGLGAGLRDADNLSWKLAAVLRGDAAEPLLDSYQTERRHHVRGVIRLAVVAGWAMTGGQDRAAALRRVVLAAVWRVPGATGLALRRTSPPLAAGALAPRRPLRRRLRGGRELVGSCLPQPWVEGPHGQCRLDDLLGDGFALVVVGPLGERARRLAARFAARVIRIGRPAHPAGEVASEGTGPAGDGSGVTAVDAPQLRRLLARAGAQAVLVRPDRVVAAMLAPAPRAPRVRRLRRASD